PRGEHVEHPAVDRGLVGKRDVAHLEMRRKFADELAAEIAAHETHLDAVGHTAIVGARGHEYLVLTTCGERRADIAGRHPVIRALCRDDDNRGGRWRRLHDRWRLRGRP